MRLFALLLLAASASAQTPPVPLVPPLGPPSATEPADSLTVSLLTMLPGREVYSLFGHSALRFRSDARGLDRTYNFGTFDFDQPFFMARFARGQLDYILDTAPFADELAKYQFLERPVIEQRLALTPATAERLLANLEENAQPENRAYRYNFLFDNCSTRLLDVIERAASESGQGRVALAPAPAHPTFRELLYQNTRGTPTIAFGMNLAVGTPTDRPATDREQTFLPVGLAAALDRATVGGQPLVASRDTLFWVPGAGSVPERTEPVVPALLALLGLGWVAAALRPARFARLGRVSDAILFGIAGVAGLVVAFLWFATDHTVTGPNLNLLWAFPAHLWLAFGRPSRGRQIYAAVAAAGAVAALIVHGAGVQTLPVGALALAAVIAVRASLIAKHRPQKAHM
ncbi:MAG TPA: DUF4105 domain-containing protein [Rubricoccaceae bacterium]|jgi:hypothetical protein